MGVTEPTSEVIPSSSWNQTTSTIIAPLVSSHNHEYSSRRRRRRTSSTMNKKATIEVTSAKIVWRGVRLSMSASFPLEPDPPYRRQRHRQQHLEHVVDRPQPRVHRVATFARIHPHGDFLDREAGLAQSDEHV